MTCTTLFQITERDDRDHTRRVTLTGELDMASAPQLQERLQQLAASGQAVCLDLSRLDFIDSSGVSTIVPALENARRDGLELAIDPHLSPRVARLVTITGLDRQFWPSDGANQPTA
jgi:anti-sigma B factor antagonist